MASTFSSRLTGIARASQHHQVLPSKRPLDKENVEPSDRNEPPTKFARSLNSSAVPLRNESYRKGRKDHGSEVESRPVQLSKLTDHANGSSARDQSQTATQETVAVTEQPQAAQLPPMQVQPTQSQPSHCPQPQITIDNQLHLPSTQLPHDATSWAQWDSMIQILPEHIVRELLFRALLQPSGVRQGVIDHYSMHVNATNAENQRLYQERMKFIDFSSCASDVWYTLNEKYRGSGTQEFEWAWDAFHEVQASIKDISERCKTSTLLETGKSALKALCQIAIHIAEAPDTLGHEVGKKFEYDTSRTWDGGHPESNAASADRRSCRPQIRSKLAPVESPRVTSSN